MHAETAGNTWGETYQYDGFGNLTVKTPTKGSAPAWSATYNAATNWQMGVQYDANGNPPVGTFDVENRLVSEIDPSTGDTVSFLYDPWGKRVIRQDQTTGASQYTLYGVTGQRLAVLACTFNGQWSTCATSNSNVYFKGRLLMSAPGGYMSADRVGSVGTGSAYFPYGEEKGSPPTPTGVERFGTYYRDFVGQDYADQRYYNSMSGRFLTPDRKGGTLNSPQSLNRYAYVVDDPVNLNDPLGLCPPGYVPATSDQLQDIVDTAESYVGDNLTHANGVHYVDPSGVLTAIDCTGLIAQALAGIDYTPTNFQRAPTADQFPTGQIPNLFAAVTTSPQVGDIISFGNHAGIVTGVSNGQVTSFVGSQGSVTRPGGPADVNLASSPHWASQLSSAKVYQPCVPASNSASAGPGPEVFTEWDPVYGTEGNIIEYVPYFVPIGNWSGIGIAGPSHAFDM